MDAGLNKLANTRAPVPGHMKVQLQGKTQRQASWCLHPISPASVQLALLCCITDVTGAHKAGIAFLQQLANGSRSLVKVAISGLQDCLAHSLTLQLTALEDSCAVGVPGGSDLVGILHTIELGGDGSYTANTVIAVATSRLLACPKSDACVCACGGIALAQLVGRSRAAFIVGAATLRRCCAVASWCQFDGVHLSWHIAASALAWDAFNGAFVELLNWDLHWNLHTGVAASRGQLYVAVRGGSHTLLQDQAQLCGTPSNIAIGAPLD